MSVSFSETLEQERAKLLRIANDCLERSAADDDEKKLEELLASATTIRQIMDEVLRQHADTFSKNELIGLQSALHAALDERFHKAVKAHYERRFRQLTEQARRDALTGLLNRAAFELRLNEEIARALRHGRDLTLVMFDVDGFKSVNDGFGHQTGDQVLAGVAKALQSSFRLSDPVFRYGGDEFVAICPETSGAVIETALRRVESQLRIFKKQAGFVPNISLSWGIASLPTETVNAYEMIRLADQRLYRCKRDKHDNHQHHRQPVAEL